MHSDYSEVPGYTSNTSVLIFLLSNVIPNINMSTYDMLVQKLDSPDFSDNPVL